jgi:hypothetical protein
MIAAALRGLFRVGTIDAVGVAVMAAALILAVRAAQRTLAARPHRAGTPRAAMSPGDGAPPATAADEHRDDLTAHPDVM